MDNEVIITINNIELHFKLKSQKIVELEKKAGKSIFKIFQDVSFTNIRDLLWAALLNTTAVADENALIDLMLTKYSVVEISNEVLSDIAVISGILKKKELDEAENEMSAEEIKN